MPFKEIEKILILRYENIIGVKDDSIISCIFRIILVIIGRSMGPDFYQIFEVPKNIQKVLQ